MPSVKDRRPAIAPPQLGRVDESIEAVKNARGRAHRVKED